MKAHVPPLNSFAGEGTKRTEVLCKPDRRHHHRQLLSALGAKQLLENAEYGLDAGRTADRAHCHRKLDLSVKVTVRSPPAGQRFVPAVSRSVGMRAGLEATPVVAGRDAHGIDPVHDSLVVSGGAIWIGCRKSIGFDDAPR